MCNLYSITTNQAVIIALFRVVNRNVGKRGQIAACMAAGAKAAQRAIDKALAPKKKRSHRPE
jgi:hypothetical protein